MRTNPLSAMGRMSYAGHLALYPVVFGSLYFGWTSYSKKSADDAAKYVKENMPKARVVDPDDFQPFSAIPFHNNT